MDYYAERHMPVLRAVVELFNDPPDMSQALIESRLIVERTGLSAKEVQLGLRALKGADPPLFAVKDVQSFGYYEIWAVYDVTQRAQEMVGVWPPTPEIALERLLASLQDEIAAEPDPERRGILQRALRSLSELPQQVAVTLLARMLTGEM